MYKKFWKRFFDFILSLLALVVLSPVLLILSIIGAVSMKGNPFFTQPRPGKDERIFNLPIIANLFTSMATYRYHT